MSIAAPLAGGLGPGEIISALSWVQARAPYDVAPRLNGQVQGGPVGFDVARVRGLYPTLGEGIAHLDGTYSALQPETVIRAIITTLRLAPAQPGSTSLRSQRGAVSVANARQAIADLVGSTPDCVVLGSNVSTLLQRFAWLVAREWQLGDEIVVSRLDHDANVRPWVTAAKTVGAIVQWAEIDVETGALPDWQYEKLINTRTRVVTLPLANPVTGAVPDVRRIADLVHAMGAVLIVDAGAALPHMPIDMWQLGADLLGVSTATFGGPTAGAVVARPGLLHEIDEDSAAPVLQGYEIGSLPIELLDGVTAAIEHLASLDESATGSRRQRLLTSIAAAEDYQRRLFAMLDVRLRQLRGLTVLGSGTERVPVLAFTVAGHPPASVGDFLRTRGISVWTGPNGMSQLMLSLGADELGGAVHVGIMPYTTATEVDHLVRALAEFTGS
jgi:cysteine desulfurase family protein (TIGR01976 family)